MATHTSNAPARRSEAAYLEMRAAFARAQAEHPHQTHEPWFRFAGHDVRMRIVGDRLAAHITRAFSHLQESPNGSTTSELHVDLWDRCATGTASAPTDGLDPPEASWLVQGGRLSASGDRRLVAYERLQSTTWMDRDTGEMAGWRACGGELPLFERSKPLPLLLPTWYADRGVQIIHAAVVSLGGKGALVAGASGAGKSTTALSCLRAGLGYLGDDHTGLQEIDGTFVAHSIYSSARLAPDQMERFQFSKRAATPSDEPVDPKWLIALPEIYPECMERSAEIRVIMLPRVGQSSNTRACPVSKGQALLAIAPSSLIVPLHAGARGMDRLARLVENVPSFRLDLGHDLEGLPMPFGSYL